jgi:16S rRNA (guanine527-N7)-methyltransferase
LNTNNILELSLKELGINFSQDQVRIIEEYLNLVYKYNKKFNLIGTKDKRGILIRHILDSISILKYEKEIFSENSHIEKILDIGTGAGLPGALLSIFLSNKLFYLLDKTLKKINFLNLLTEELKFKNVSVIRGRAEELAKENLYRESFDIVLARAVTGFSILSELTIPFCRINGKIIFYKSKKILTELEENRGAISKLGGKVDNLLEIKVPYLDEYRTFLIVRKVKESPKIYPRNFNKIKNKPL